MAFDDNWPAWGATGTQPPDGLDYVAGDNPQADHFDYLWYYLRESFNSVRDEFDATATDIQAVADDLSAHSTTTSGVHGVASDDTVAGQSDIDAAISTLDSDGDNTVDEADVGLAIEARTNYPSNPEVGRIVFRTDKTA